MAVYYGSPTSIGAGDGTAWQDAMDLNALINSPFLQAGDEIWALGDNNVFGTGGRYDNISLHLSLSLYGGFEGTETSPGQRNVNIDTNNGVFFQNPSYLNGRGQYIALMVGAGHQCLIDGFLIQNGQGTPEGGGMHVAHNSNITVENVVFQTNYADKGGGAFLIECNAFFKNVIFLGNNAIDGGGIFMEGCDVTLVNVLFTDNSASQQGGAIFMINCHNVTIVNNTIAGNSASVTQSNGIYCDNSNLTINNSILFSDFLTSANGSNVVANNSLPPLMLPGSNNLPVGTDPEYVGSGTPSAYKLRSTSPCIDAGDAGFVFVNTDLEGNPRILGNNVDMGAFECF